MCENDWWSCYGPFKRWRVCTSRPDAGEVLHFYLGKREIPPEEQVAYLSKLFELQKSMVYNILKGEGLDSIIHCRQLVRALQIHPPLLGIDAKYYPIERHPYWWRELGFDFQADAEGYPVLSEVIRYLRLQRTQGDEKDRVKIWSQEDLADATGLKKETIYRMEHDRNPLILENMSRRARIASALGTLAGEQEPTIFQLFGLDPQAYDVIVSQKDVIPEVHGLPEHLTDEILDEYQQTLVAFFTAYYTGHGHNVFEEALEWLRRLEALQPKVNTTAQRVTLIALQCRYHQLISGIAREQHKEVYIKAHAALAVRLAEQTLTLPKPQLGEHALLTLTNELLAAALLWRADTYYDFYEYSIAQVDIDRALNLLPEIQSSHLKAHIAAEAGLLHAYTAKSEVDRALVLSYFNLATQMLTPNQWQPAALVLDDHCMYGGMGLLYLRKAMALSASQMRGTTADSVHDLLETAQKVTPPELLRQHTLIEVFLALDAYAEGDYSQATEYALDALERCRQIGSYPNKDRIEALYEKLLNTGDRDSPRFSYLGWKLRTWDHGAG